MPKPPTTIDLNLIPASQRAYVQQCIADSAVLRECLQAEALPSWRIMHLLGTSIMEYMSSEHYLSAFSQSIDAMELRMMYRHMGYLIDHLEKSSSHEVNF